MLPNASGHRFTTIYTAALFTYGITIEGSLTSLYTGVNIGFFILFGVLHVWASWPLHALWAVSLVGLGNMLGGPLVAGNSLYMAEVVGPLRYDKIFHALAAGAMVVIA